MNVKFTNAKFLLPVALLFLLAIGCQTETNSSQDIAKNQQSDSQKDECCGKCKQESKSAEAESCATDKQCCASENQIDASGKTGCCGKCQLEIANAAIASETASGEQDEKVNSLSEDRDTFHYLLQNHKKIKRTVTELEDGVKTLTESDDPDVAAKIQEHVKSMHGRINDKRPLRMWDSLFQAIFKHADKVQMEYKNTKHGVAVTETSDDPYVVLLIQAHAKVVTGFSERGFAEARENHVPPKKEN